MPRPNVPAPKRKRKVAPAPGYCAPYWKKHRYITSTLTNQEHEALRSRAEAEGIAPTTLATSIIRDYLSTPINPDNWEDSPNMYAVEEEGA